MEELVHYRKPHPAGCPFHIPTHLSSQRDLFCASFVCRHWRRTLLQCAELWSQLDLSKGEVYVKTLLECAKGSSLDIIISDGVPVSTITQLSSHTKQIKDLYFTYDRLAEVRELLEADPEPLPLLQTLRIFVHEDDDLGDDDAIIPPYPLLFSNAVNIKVLYVNSCAGLSPLPRPFVFPNLVSFVFFIERPSGFSPSRLLDLLEASPTLRTVHIEIVAARTWSENIPRGRVVVLPNVETLTLITTNCNGVYRIAAHKSCPSARYTSLVYEDEVDVEDGIPEGMFPDSDSWNVIVSPLEEVKLEMETTPLVACILTFRSADATLVELRLNVTHIAEELDGLSIKDVHNEVFTQALGTVSCHPQLTDVKRLRIFHGLYHTETTDGLDSAGWLIKSSGPLDELTIYNCDLRLYLDPFLDYPKSHIGEPIVLPPIKQLTISHPLGPFAI
jgi:hypothetical protein